MTGPCSRPFGSTRSSERSSGPAGLISIPTCSAAISARRRASTCRAGSYSRPETSEIGLSNPAAQGFDSCPINSTTRLTRRSSNGDSALLLPAPSEARHHTAQPAPDLLARVSGDPADRIVGLDGPQLLVRRARRTPAGDCLGGLRAIARAAGLDGVDLRLQAGDVVVGIW